MSPTSRLLQSIAGIDYGFGTIAAPYPQTLLAMREAAPRWTQNHGITHARVEQAKMDCGPCDALSTVRPHIPIVVATADCTPVIVVGVDSNDNAVVVSAIHAGWRGTLARITEHTARELITENVGKVERWCAVVGPSIGPCCFEVGDDVRDAFVREFGSDVGDWVRMRPAQRSTLNLWAVNTAQLRRAGIANIESLELCTYCSREVGGTAYRFHSYRREKGTTRQWSGAALTGELKI